MQVRKPINSEYRGLPQLPLIKVQVLTVGKRRPLPTNMISSRLGVLSKGCTGPAWLNMANTCWTDAPSVSTYLRRKVIDALSRARGGFNAGELAHLWVVAIEPKLKLRNLAQMIAPYPTWGELNKAAASEFSKTLLRSRFTHGVVRALSWVS
jgi:hypothetical protein